MTTSTAPILRIARSLVALWIVAGCAGDERSIASPARVDPPAVPAGAPGVHDGSLAGNAAPEPLAPLEPTPGPEPAQAPADAAVAPDRDPAVLEPTPTVVVADPADEAAYIYDSSALRTYELLISAENLALIDADPRAEQYVEGTLLFEGRSYGPVGVRYKGSVGGFKECTATSTGGPKTCTKLSMKISFDWQDPEGRFYGLRKLQFHAMNRDPSMLKERLGYSIFRDFGVAAPRAVHARLLINGGFVGLFGLVEQIDGRFTRSRFSEGGEGNLYKEAWPLTSERLPIDETTLRPKLETNQAENASLATMLAFGQALAPADLATQPQVLAQFTDLDYAMRYVAVDRTIAHDDGPFHWYCGSTACSNHNYFWYEERTSARLWPIAWDLDNGFNLDNAVTTLWIAWDDTSVDCTPRTQAPFNVPLRAPACDKLVLGWANQQQLYLSKVGALLDGPLQPDAIDGKLQAWEAQIAPVVDEAARTHLDAVPVAQWQQARDALRAAIETLRARATARIQQGPKPIRDPWM